MAIDRANQEKYEVERGVHIKCVSDCLVPLVTFPHQSSLKKILKWRATLLLVITFC